MASSTGFINGYARYCVPQRDKTYTMRYYSDCTWSESYDSSNNLTCSNFSVTIRRSSEDGGYMQTCPSQNCKTTEGACFVNYTCSIASSLSSSPSWTQVGSFNFACVAASATIGSRSIPGSFTLAPGESRTIAVARGGSCAFQTHTITIRNNRSKPQPIPPSVSARASCSSSNYNNASFSASVSYGFCESAYNSTTYRITDSNGSTIRSGSGTSVSISTLQPNSQYSVTFTASNGCYTRTSSASTVTATGNTLTDATPKTWDSASVRLVPIMGGGYYSSPSHQIQIKTCSGGSWRTVATSNSTSPTVISFDGLTEETCYQLRCITSNGSACSYTGNTLQFTTPKKGICLAEYIALEGGLNSRCSSAYEDICYSYETLLTPADIIVYYRVKDGFDPTWLVADSRTINNDKGNVCFRLDNLFTNQVVYETYIHTHTAEVDWDSDVQTFTTELCPEASSENCESLTYMTEYLCQAVKKLYKGNKTIYANPYSQKYCDPYTEDPTHLTLWSRYLRLMHAYLCILCGFVNLSNSHKGQYLVGELGWVQILEEIVESQLPTDGWKLATSDAIYKYLQEKLKQVWHYQGTVDVLVDTVADLANYPNAKNAIVTSENSIYDYTNGEWVKNTTLIPENFGVWHINDVSDQAKAESGWYYWEGTWNNLDGDIELIEEAIKDLEERSDNLIQNEPGYDRKIKVVGTDYDIYNSPEDANVIYVVAEPLTLPAPTYYTVTFAREDGTVIQTQEVLSGALATSFYPNRMGYEFLGWEVDGETWNDQMPVTSDMTVIAKYTIIMSEVMFDINGAEGVAPDPIVVPYGGTISSLPTSDGFSYGGKTFGGWEENGVVWTTTTPVYLGVTLRAIWDAVMLSVALDYGDDTPNTILQVAYGNYIDEPAAPEKAGYDFVGWKTQSGELFDFSQPITENITLVATYELHNVVVTFNVQTLPPNADETVENPEPQVIARNGYATEPTVLAENYIINYWTLNGEEFNFDTPVSEDITLVAVWSPVVLVDFDADGGEPAPAQQRVPQGGYATKPEDPQKEGCEFTGWSEVPMYIVTFNTAVPGLNWTVKVSEGETVNEPTFVPTRNGYVFKGWDYDFTQPITADTTINAIWNPLYTVTFDPGYDGAQITTVEVENGQTVAQPADPTNPDTNCTFEGWKEEDV